MFPVHEFSASIQSYVPHAEDVVLAPFAKCGTAWLQQCLHCLRSGGDETFDDISRIVPWIETAHALGVDLSAAQGAWPRAYKSHLPFDLLPSGPRFVVAFRDPVAALESHYRFMEGWFFDGADIAIEDFALSQLRAWAYWHHLRSWWSQRRNPDVLLLSFDRMVRDSRPAIARIARFCGIAADQALIDLTAQRTSLAYMQRHASQFAEQQIRELAERRGGLPPGGNSSRVRGAEADRAGLVLPPRYREAIEELWQAEITPQTGFANFAEFEAALAG